MKKPRSHSSSLRPKRERNPALVKLWRWRIARADEPIPLNQALTVGDCILDSLARTAWTTSGSGRLPVCLHGPHEPKEVGWNHGHAFVLSEDTDCDGLVDHISLSAAVGLDPAAIRLLSATDRVALSTGNQVELVFERAGSLDQLASNIRGPSHVWVSRTPYLFPGRNRSRFDPKDAARQLKHEISERYPTAVLLEPPQLLDELTHAGRRLLSDSFQLKRPNGAAPPEAAQPCFFRLVFSRPLDGPLAFGWGCHQGLGLFVAEL